MRDHNPAGNEPEREHLAIVGIGASAESLLALRVPARSAFAFVVVTHLDPTRESHMAEILGRYTEQHVHEPKHGEPLAGGTVYTIAPGSDLAVENGRLAVSKTEEHPDIARPVDRFLRALAKDQKEFAIALILSGTGSDGFQGVKEIKGEGGLVLVQDPQTAEHNGMPRSAIATGVVDRIVPVKEMPQIMRDYAQQVCDLPRPRRSSTWCASPAARSSCAKRA